MKNYVLLGISVLAGVMAFFLSQHNIAQEKKKLNLLARQVRVLAAKQDLLPGDIITRDSLALRAVYERQMSPQMVKKDEANLVIGQKLANDLQRGNYLLWQDIDMPQVGRGTGLARRIKTKERALSLSVDHVSSVSGLISPNDHVDILGTFRFPDVRGNAMLDTVTLTLLQDVTVLAVGQSMAGGGTTRGRSYSSITLNVSPDEAELLVFAQKKGDLTLTLRHPRDVYINLSPQSVNFTYLRDKLEELARKRAKRTGALR